MPHDKKGPIRGKVAPLLALIALVVTVSGCKAPQGTHSQVAGIGVSAEPFGSAPQAPKVRLGSFAAQYSTPVPQDSGPSLNRSDMAGPLGVSQHSTQAIGPVGEQVSKGGPTLERVIGALHPAGVRGALIPFELPPPATEPPAARPATP